MNPQEQQEILNMQANDFDAGKDVNVEKRKKKRSHEDVNKATSSVKKPRGRFLIFSATERAKLVEKFKDVEKKPTKTEITHMISKAWKEVTDFTELDNLVQEDRERFENEIEKVGLTYSDFNIKKKKKTDPNIPKRPLNAYFNYMMDNMGKMKEEYPDAPYNEIRTKLSERWKTMDAKSPIKIKYGEMSKKANEVWVIARDEYMKSETRKTWEMENHK